MAPNGSSKCSESNPNDKIYILISEYLSYCQYYEEESYQDFLVRYEGYGKEFYAALKKKLPSIIEQLKFYKAQKAVKNAFKIQLKL